MFDFTLNEKTGRITAEYKINKAQAQYLVEKGVSQDFLEMLRNDKNNKAGDYAIIGKEGTFKKGFDGSIIYPPMQFEAYNYDEMRRLIRYMNRVTGYYAFKENQYLENPSNLRKGTDKFIE